MKGRIWAFIAYPESIKENWREILEESGLQFAISPLHDRDINPDGEKKKEHYHVLVEYTGPTTYNNVNKLCESIGATIPKKVESARGYYRYLVHADNPDKAQYDFKDIQRYNGFEIDLTETEESAILRKICQIIRTTETKEYKDLLDYFEDIGDYDYWKICSKKTIFLNSYLSSYRNKYKRNN
jgi:hypothetical protein